MKPVTFNNTVLRDGHQSLAATRMTTAQMLHAAPILDGMGFSGLETWGGATIDSCLRYLNENPFDRLRALKKAAPQTPQIMLLRGQNIVQYTSFPDDVVAAFVRADAAAGQDIFRIFDALNDTASTRCWIARNTREEKSAIPPAPSTPSKPSSRWASSLRKWAVILSASRTCPAS
jgi:oxaloacetate decarboxylase alpha subunit/pyruvate carboxylase subunit B